MTVDNLMAVPALDAQAAGAIVFWRLAGAVSYDDLDCAWAGAALDARLLPSPVGASTALKRTMQTFREKNVMVKPLRTGADGFVLVHETYVDGRPSYRNGLEVTLKDDGGLTMDPFDDETAAQLSATYGHHLEHLTPQDVSSWLVWLVRTVLAVRLRDTGGIYFVPRDHLETWRRYVGAIRAASHCAMFEIPAMRTDEAAAAILDAVTREAQEVAEELAQELQGDLSARALRGRGKRIAELEGKLAAYENLLGVKLEALREQFGELQAKVAAAVLAADGEE
jgi:hypothetical protein